MSRWRWGRPLRVGLHWPLTVGLGRPLAVYAQGKAGRRNGITRRMAVGLVAILALTGCDQRAWFEKFIPREEAEFAKNCLALLQARDFEALEARIDPNLRNAQLRPTLEKVSSFFPKEKPRDIQIVGAQTLSTGDATQVNLTFQYSYPRTWLLANVVIQKRGNDAVVSRLNVQQLADSLENINRFAIDGKGIRHFVVLGLALGVPLLILFSTVLCIMTPMAKRKWVWLVFILIGVGQVTLNWTDGTLDINPLGFQVLGAGFWKASAYGPLLLSVSVPLGAILFLFRRRKWLMQTKASPSPGSQA